MEGIDRIKHWENIYQTKKANEVSWYQTKPETSLAFIAQLNIPKTAKIIDIGGGDSFLVDNLLELGYTNITVLDISQSAIERAKKRLGILADQVKWIVEDASTFHPTEKYKFWHDRAAFHFLTQENEIQNYLETLRKCLEPNGYVVIGTFSEQGPNKCSGLKICQYSETTIAERFSGHFEKINCITVDHHTPFNSVQNFIFCSFKKIQEK